MNWRLKKNFTNHACSSEICRLRDSELKSEVLGIIIAFLDCDDCIRTLNSCLVALNEQQTLCRRARTGQEAIQNVINDTFRDYSTSLFKLSILLPKLNAKILCLPGDHIKTSSDFVHLYSVYYGIA